MRLITFLRSVWFHRDLVLSMVRRQYQVRYRQSLVGFVWAFVPPLTMVAAATLIFDGVAKVDTGKTPYPIFAFAALVPWSFLGTSLSFGVPSITQSAQMVSRLAFPRAVLPISMVGTALIDLGITSLTFLVFAYVSGYGLPLTAAWYPVLLLVEMLLVMGVVLLGSALNVFARDIRLAVPVITQLWLFLTPVFYPLDSVPEGLRSWYLLNPMTGVVESFRRILIFGDPPAIGLLAPALVGTAVALVIGTWYFAATESRFSDVI